MQKLTLPILLILLSVLFLLLVVLVLLSLPRDNKTSISLNPVNRGQVLATYTTTFNPSADAWISSTDPDTNYSTGTGLLASYSPGTYKRRSVIKFDLSSIPSTATVNSGVFSVYLAECTGPASTEFLYIGVNNSSWSEGSVTWNNKPSFLSGPYIQTAACSSAGSYLNYDLTAHVRSWISGSLANHGLTLYGVESSSSFNYKLFNSRENAGNKPKLVINYSLPDSAAPTGSDTGSPTNNSGSNSSSNTQATTQNQTSEKIAISSPKSATTSQKIGSATPSTKKTSQSNLKPWIIVILISILLALILIRYREPLLNQVKKFLRK